jgi:hypothetical protein
MGGDGARGDKKVTATLEFRLDHHADDPDLPTLKLKLRIEFDPETDPWYVLKGKVTLQEASLGIEYGFLCFGFDLAEFSRSLQNFHQCLNGSAEFVNQEGSLRIVMKMLDQDRRIGSEVHLWRFLDPKLGHVGPDWISFGGFRTDQSYLPSIIASIESFIDDNGIPTEHPHLGMKRWDAQKPKGS